MKHLLKRLQDCITLGLGQNMIGVHEVGSTKETEQAILTLFRALRRETKQRLEEGEREQVPLDLMSDLTHLMSDKGVSEMTGSTEQEKFHKKWDGII